MKTLSDLDVVTLCRRVASGVTSCPHHPSPDVIVAISGGGLVPSRYLRNFLKCPILVVGIKFYDDTTNAPGESPPQIIQWLDPSMDLSDKNVLIVDEVDDSRKTLETCIGLLRETHNPKTITVGVLHNKVREKVGTIPSEICLHAGDVIADEWIIYPWEASKYTSVAVLGSTNGSTFDAIASSLEDQSLILRCVISNRSSARILDKARERSIPALCIADEKTLDCVLRERGVEWVLLIGYMKVLSRWFVDRWEGKILNVHPSLLPAHAGGMDGQVHQSVLAAGDKETGCTIHLVTPQVDKGPIVIQKRCFVERGKDSVQSLKERVQKLEVEAWSDVFTLIQLRSGLHTVQ